MKLIILYKNPLIGKQRLFPRDIRNYIGSISNEADKEFTMWHKRELPPLIYTMPNRKGFAIISYKNDDATKELFERIKNNVLENKNIRFNKNNIDTEVKEAYIINYSFNKMTPQYEERVIKTPMLMRQFARAKSITRGVDKVDIRELENLVKDEIKESITYMCKGWLDEDIELDDLMLVFKNLEYKVIKYNDTQYFPAVSGTIISNRKLPDFIGYNVGLGYGELERAKNTQQRVK